MDIEQARFNMVKQQIRPWDVLDTDVLEVMTQTPRELFVPDQYRNLAFSDLEIPLPHGQRMMVRNLRHACCRPCRSSLMTAFWRSGQAADLLAPVSPARGNHVDTIEWFEDLSAQAQEALGKLEIKNVRFIQGDALCECMDRQYRCDRCNRLYTRVSGYF